MLPPFRPAVFACPMRCMHGKKPKKVWPPPYPAWPEIADPSTLYTLPTVASHPAIKLCVWRPRWWWDAYWNSVKCYTDRELVYVMFPDDAEEILAKLPTTIVDAYDIALDLLDIQTISIGNVRFYTAMAIADPEWSTFALHHEMGHSFSFGTARPTILEVNRIASGIFALFKKLTLTACENFWDEFQKGNDILVRYLDSALILEEVRANLYAFSCLDPIIRANVEPDLRKVMAEEGAISLFDTLTDITNEDWFAAFWLTLLAEYSPADPLKRLHFLCKRGVYDYSSTILNVAVDRLDEQGWKVHLDELKYRTPEIFFTPPDEYEVSAVPHLSLSDVRELVFLESLRQQLAQFFGVSLVCPFQQSGRTCCGFGHYMRAIWEQVRPEHRSAKAVLHPETGKEIVVRPPRKACLHYGLG